MVKLLVSGDLAALIAPLLPLVRHKGERSPISDGAARTGIPVRAQDGHAVGALAYRGLLERLESAGHSE